jgi:hypothetical protein
LWQTLHNFCKDEGIYPQNSIEMQEVSKSLIKVFKSNKKIIKKQMQVKDLLAIIDSLKDLNVKDEEFILDMKKVLKSTLHKISTS